MNAIPGSLRRLLGAEGSLVPVVLGLVLIWAFFATQESTFLTARNLSNLVLQIAVTATIALGVVFVLLLGEIDLAVGSVAGATSALLGVLIVNHGVAWWQAIVLMLLMGALIGAAHGAWIALARVPSFIVTLAGLLGWLGLQLHILGDQGSVNVFEPRIADIATTYLPESAGWALAIVGAASYAVADALGQARRRRDGLRPRSPAATVARDLTIAAVLLGFVGLLNASRGVPTAGVIVLALAVVLDFVAVHTKFGRYVYAIGGSAEAARRAGINVSRVRVYVFTLSATLAAIGGLLQVSRGAAATTDIGGGTLLLEAIAAAVIGGVSLFGGHGRIWGALLGALVIGSVSNGLDLIGQPADVKYMVEGGILLIAVTVDAASRRGRAGALA